MVGGVNGLMVKQRVKIAVRMPNRGVWRRLCCTKGVEQSVETPPWHYILDLNTLAKLFEEIQSSPKEFTRRPKDPGLCIHHLNEWGEQVREGQSASGDL